MATSKAASGRPVSLAGAESYALSLEARCQQMDATCQRLEVITTQILHAVEAIDNYKLPSQTDNNFNKSLTQTTPPIRTFSRVGEKDLNKAGMDVSDNTNPSPYQPVVEDEPQDHLGALGYIDVDMSDSTESDDDPDVDVSDGEGAIDQATAFVKDSYGRFRFVGGSANKMLIDAAKGMSPSSRAQPSQTPGSSALMDTGSAHGDQISPEDDDVELPLFVRGKIWPELPFLPRPEQLTRPPQYISDLLVGLYFDKLHYTFPVLFKPHFMRSYGKKLRCGPNASSPSLDKDFLRVFFAVCASGLLPANPDGGFPGFEYYEKSLLLHYASPGQASLERVQCLGLLAMCTASWNTLTQSWSLAGLAVRSSMDIGLHVNSQFTMPHTENSGDAQRARTLQNQIERPMSISSDDTI
ncbi:c6 zinc finger domain containing protein [Grosmannia clavigera kw1407]|uniref:C6 zinc finger domain containing protein n=1 Tax=Grosmannia clavigera (strain kw1407 / UAMH 11150) TaxID=655863 RepID=F0XQT6_GROCL|nr:c6 zinc finger domain containing protein [Grosmannia clavigera kw1407]EFW99754.1 c6 zinc finger domain containing protein [Grosmannia clavigera kw1407]